LSLYLPLWSFLSLTERYVTLGDEILSVNGVSLQGMSHGEAIAIFKNIRAGLVNINLARRDGLARR
jgi:hypothetical protein